MPAASLPLARTTPMRSQLQDLFDDPRTGHGGCRPAVDKAVALNSNSAVALTYRSAVLGICGEAQAATADAQKAMRLNPTDPNSFLPQMAMVFAKLKMGDNDEAASWARKVMQINPRYPIAYIFLMVAECRRGIRAAAESRASSTRRHHPGFWPEQACRNVQHLPARTARGVAGDPAKRGVSGRGIALRIMPASHPSGTSSTAFGFFHADSAIVIKGVELHGCTAACPAKGTFPATDDG